MPNSPFQKGRPLRSSWFDKGKRSWFDAQHAVPDEQALVKFLSTSSQKSLSGFFLRRLEHDQQLRRDILQLIDQAIDNMAMVRLADFLRDNREAIRENIRTDALGGE